MSFLKGHIIHKYVVSDRKIRWYVGNSLVCDDSDVTYECDIIHDLCHLFTGHVIRKYVVSDSKIHITYACVMCDACLSYIT